MGVTLFPNCRKLFNNTLVQCNLLALDSILTRLSLYPVMVVCQDGSQRNHFSRDSVHRSTC